MIKGVYSLRDRETGFLDPFLAVTDSRAEQAVLTSSLKVARDDGVDPESFRDYDLYRLGTFDDDDGTLAADPIRTVLLTGHNVEFFVRRRLSGEEDPDVSDDV